MSAMGVGLGLHIANPYWPPTCGILLRNANPSRCSSIGTARIYPFDKVTLSDPVRAMQANNAVSTIPEDEMTDPRNIAHDKKIQQEKKHRHESIAPGADVTPQPGRKSHMEHHASDVPKSPVEGAEEPGKL